MTHTSFLATIQPGLSVHAQLQEGKAANMTSSESAVGWQGMNLEAKELLFSKDIPAASPRKGNQQLSEEVPSERWLPVFDVEKVWEAKLAARDDAKSYEAMRPIFDAALDYEGRRKIPLLNSRVLAARLRRLALQMPNFAPAIEYLVAELGFVLTGDVRDFRIEPLLLVGGPGLGKTRFVGELAAILGVHYEKISVGTLQSSADLGGSSRMWSNTRPGRIARLMAKSQEACSAILLDEIDKLSQSNDHPITPMFLELLELDSAKTFRDECLDIRFDASRLIHVATANEIDLISAPLRSRFRIVEIKAPDLLQRREIILNVFKEIIGQREFEIKQDVIDVLAEVDIDLRELRRCMREAVGRALLKEERSLSTGHLIFPTQIERRKIGFI